MREENHYLVAGFHQRERRITHLPPRLECRIPPMRDEYNRIQPMREENPSPATQAIGCRIPPMRNEYNRIQPMREENHSPATQAIGCRIPPMRNE
jgi:hypothetical protein